MDVLPLELGQLSLKTLDVGDVLVLGLGGDMLSEEVQFLDHFPQLTHTVRRIGPRDQWRKRLWQ